MSGEPIVVGDASLPQDADDCGCCAGIVASVPAPRGNAPGLPAIAYRAGTHASLKETMLARLSAPDFPPLGALRTRNDDDPAIALIDAWATVADVLTFYQERIANESYLPTATDSFTVTALAQLIGYQRGPGVAASLELAFTLEPAPGAPELAVAETLIEAGTRAQSVPGPGETAQFFETTEALLGRVAWNALKPRQTVTHRLRPFDRVVFARGIVTTLKVGDPILVVGSERPGKPEDAHWELRTIAAVTPDAAADRTMVTLDANLGAAVSGSTTLPPAEVFLLRQRAALFGYNAPDPRSFHPEVIAQYGTTIANKEWDFTIPGNEIDLDGLYPGIVAPGWAVLATAPLPERLYELKKVRQTGRSSFAMSSKTTRLTLSGPSLAGFAGGSYRGTAVYCESELLPLARAPVIAPVSGAVVVLDHPLAELPEGRRLIVRGKRPVLEVTAASLTLMGSGTPPATKIAKAGDRLWVMGAPAARPGGLLRWPLRDAGGFEGTTDLPQVSEPRFVPPAKDDPVIAEPAILLALEREDDDHARLRLKEPLRNAYDRGSTEVLANVAPASHGESVSDILGSGDAGQPYQRFALRQRPLTYRAAAAGEGAVTTLRVRVNDVLWQEVPSLLGHGPRERVFTTRLEDDGNTIVQFGDGNTGARLPTGQDNVQAQYRKGTGLAGLVEAGQVSMLAARPLGVKAVTNPLASAVAQDPAGLEEVRRRSPGTVLALGRAVSLRDFEDFARAFAGIEKASATVLWNGRERRVFVSVAGANGADVPTAICDNLLAALQQASPPFVAVAVGSYRPVGFRLDLRVKVEAERRPGQVLAAVAAALQEQFGFARRDFGDPVSLSAVMAAASAVPGVKAVTVQRLYRDQPPNNAPASNPRLIAQPARPGAGDAIVAAELLTIAAEPFDALELLP